jgi:heterodisulfide reductase subunit C
MDMHGVLQFSFTFVYVDNVRTSQETHLWACTACYGDSYAFVYVYNVRISQGNTLWTCTACYGVAVHLYM